VLVSQLTVEYLNGYRKNQPRLTLVKPRFTGGFASSPLQSIASGVLKGLVQMPLADRAEELKFFCNYRLHRRNGFLHDF